MTHTDGYFRRRWTTRRAWRARWKSRGSTPRSRCPQRPRTMQFIQFPDHHHGEVARGQLHRHSVSVGQGRREADHGASVADAAAMIQRRPHARPTPIGAFRWNALGSPDVREDDVRHAARVRRVGLRCEDGPKNGNYAPSFHIIDHIIYHTSLDAPELVPATGTRARDAQFAAALDRANKDDAGAAPRTMLPEERSGVR